MRVVGSFFNHEGTKRWVVVRGRLVREGRLFWPRKNTEDTKRSLFAFGGFCVFGGSDRMGIGGFDHEVHERHEKGERFFFSWLR